MKNCPCSCLLDYLFHRGSFQQDRQLWGSCPLLGFNCSTAGEPFIWILFVLCTVVQGVRALSSQQWPKENLLPCCGNRHCSVVGFFGGSVLLWVRNSLAWLTPPRCPLSHGCLDSQLVTGHTSSLVQLSNHHLRYGHLSSRETVWNGSQKPMSVQNSHI